MFKYEIKWCSDSCRKSFNSLICLHLSSDVVKEALNITQLLASRFSAHHIRMVGTPQIHPLFTENTQKKKKKREKKESLYKISTFATSCMSFPGCYIEFLI